MSGLHELCRPLATVHPESGDTSDLDALREVVGDARVVCLGESAHYVSEFYQLKDRLMRFLVADLGFSAFVMESGFAEGLAVDEWVQGGSGELEDVAAAGITYRFGQCPEMHAQLRWMRDQNAGGPRMVRFYGMDVPGSSTSPGPAVRACLARLPARRGDHQLMMLSNLGGQAEAAVRYAEMLSEDRVRLHAGIAELSVSRPTATPWPPAAWPRFAVCSPNSTTVSNQAAAPAMSSWPTRCAGSSTASSASWSARTTDTFSASDCAHSPWEGQTPCRPWAACWPPIWALT